MVNISTVYQGSLRCAATHGPSRSSLHTDAPVDNQGKGEAFSPTDLVATALATCVMTTMAIVAERHGVDLSGTEVHVEKHMVADPLRRIGRLPLRVTVPTAVAADHRQRLENAAHTCPVKKSLHPDLEVTIAFSWA